MRRYMYYIAILMVLLFVPHTVYAAIGANLTAWTRDTIKTNRTISFGASHTSEVTINGQIVVNPNCTLTIKFADNYPANTHKVIRAVSNSKGNAFVRMFKIEKGGRLVIQGRDENSRIILDGGARFSGGLNDKRLLTITDAGAVTVHTCENPGGTISEELIYSNVGSLMLKWVTMQNVYTKYVDDYDGDNKYGGAIHLTGTVDDDDDHQTLLENCIIENCADHCGGALAIRMSNNNAPKDTYPAKTKVTFTNTEIRYCYTSSTSGGTIRANGRTINDVEFNNVEMHHNYAKSSGAGFLWNGGGSSETDMLINGGHFHHNVSDSKGGAMSVAANISFTGDVIIEHNRAKKDGGGISIHTYDGVVMPKRNDKTYNFTYTFPSGLIIRNNHSANGGGIAYNVDNFAIYSGWAEDPQTGVVINTTIDLQGAEISNNTATLDGGGIWLANNLETGWVTKNGATANIYVHLNSGSINNNTSAGGNGAGVYLYKTDISHVAAKAGTLSLDGNKANGSEKNGGGIYIEDGKTINLANVTTEIKNNKASNGGAIYINSTSGVQVTLGNSTISSNSVTESGGALYIKGGSLTMGEVDVTSNTATSHGGAVYVDGGNISINGGATIQDNSAMRNGGAIYVNSGNITFSGNASVLDVTGNHAIDGGSFYVNGGSINTTGIQKATITGNYATNEGGAFYVRDGNIEMGLTELSANGKNGSNTSTVNGGAIALYDGVFTFANGSEIKNNSAIGNGGALYIMNTGNLKSISCEGGTYLANIALGNGGAIYASGNIKLQVTADVRNNTAKNGGGLYLDGGVNMTFGKEDSSGLGLIVGNQATGTGTEGVGGGVYLAKGKLSFADKENLGIYNNVATYEAADIYSSGNEALVQLPKVSDMNLTGFHVPGNDLYWVLDEHGNRYEDALLDVTKELNLFTFSEDIKDINEEICLDLGYDYVLVTIIALGLDIAHDASVTMSYPDNESNYHEFRKVLFTGIGATNAVKRIVGLPSHNWKFDVTDWSYKYNSITCSPDGDSDNIIPISRSGTRVVTITFASNSSTTNISDYNARKVNILRPQN